MYIAYKCKFEFAVSSFVFTDCLNTLEPYVPQSDATAVIIGISSLLSGLRYYALYAHNNFCINIQKFIYNNYYCSLQNFCMFFPPFLAAGVVAVIAAVVAAAALCVIIAPVIVIIVKKQR